MKSMRRSLLSIFGGLILALAAALPAAAADMCDSGRDYGLMHISVEARSGVLGPDVHPGMHRGFSGCVRS
jgi:hypothetical protein